MSRIKLGVAYLVHRAGADEVSEEAFVNQASHDLHWFSPKQGRRFLEAARSLGYLVPGKAPGTVRPSFAVGGLDVPLDFRLRPADLEDLPEGHSDAGVTEELVALAARDRRVDVERVWADVRRKEERLFETPVAALLVAGEAGVDVRALAVRVRAELAGARGGDPPRGAIPSASESGHRS